MGCPMRGEPEGFKCGGGVHRHHILRRSLARGNDEVAELLNHPSLIIKICGYHNISRWPDTPKYRALLLQKNNVRWKGKTREVIESLPWKVPRKDMSWEALVEAHLG